MEFLDRTFITSNQFFKRNYKEEVTWGNIFPLSVNDDKVLTCKRRQEFFS